MPSVYYRTQEPTRQIQLRISDRLLAQVDEWGVAQGMSSRSEAIRVLLEKGTSDGTESSKE